MKTFFNSSPACRIYGRWGTSFGDWWFGEIQRFRGVWWLGQRENLGIPFEKKKANIGWEIKEGVS